jgi:DUF2934 family protein
MTEEAEQRIRERAFQLWIEDGQPEGKEKEHWERARSQIEGDTTRPEEKVATPPSGTSFGP